MNNSIERIYTHRYAITPPFKHLKIVCAICQRTKIGNDWLVLPRGYGDENESHGYCPKCGQHELFETKEALKHRKEIPGNPGVFDIDQK